MVSEQVPELDRLVGKVAVWGRGQGAGITLTGMVSFMVVALARFLVILVSPFAVGIGDVDEEQNCYSSRLQDELLLCCLTDLFRGGRDEKTGGRDGQEAR